MRIFLVTVLLMILTPSQSFAKTKLSTFIKGTLVEKSPKQWIVHNHEGTYWIKISRPPNWVRREGGGKISFWVKIDQITRFRPVKMSTASAEPPSMTSPASLP